MKNWSVGDKVWYFDEHLCKHRRMVVVAVVTKFGGDVLDLVDVDNGTAIDTVFESGVKPRDNEHAN